MIEKPALKQYQSVTYISHI